MFAPVFDFAIIGGGIIGAAIARDAAGRGLRVFLCEAGDLGGGASSATNKVVHGNLKYLEGLKLGALGEAVAEREILMGSAPHLVRPCRFILPHHRRQWPRWALSLGLFAADRLARRTLPASRRVDLQAEGAHGALKPEFEVAFAFSDCQADDARLVVLNAIDARTHGASIHPRVRAIVAEREGERWRLSLESTVTGERFAILAEALVNAAGAWAGEVLDHVIHSDQRVRVRLSKRSSIVVRRIGGDGAYALPNSDGEIVYCLSYGRDLMVIGAGPGRAVSDPAAAVEPHEVAYLLDVAGQYFERPPEAADVVRSFAAVAALPDDPAATRHDHFIMVDAPPRLAPLVSVFGGTLTTHRRIAENVLDRMARVRPVGRPWTAGAVLPGGSLPPTGPDGLGRALAAAYPFVSQEHARRLAGAYGTRAQTILSGARSAADLGVRFGADLTEAEVNFLKSEEWAMTAEDVLWRRSKLGFVLSSAEAADLEGWMTSRPVTAMAAI
ncbi:MAG: glycerol-3-phosphate dehydrogenase [Bauldia sp.]